MFQLDINKRIVILSAEQADKGASFNANASATLATRLALLLAAGSVDSIVPCDGQYKGAPERSFMVVCSRDDVHVLRDLAAEFSQECILVARQQDISGLIKGSLYYPDGTREPIGFLVPCEQGKEYDASTTISGTNITFCFE